ncbi:MAG: MBL fold metallo-hydrolase [Sedimentisphaerales bacterium]|nr:MBL fold metallo-hydrolase [Sedimentisphaerales bacterium]
MQLKLNFLGAVQNVTGSRHLLQANGTKVLVDCGLYQERHFKARNWEPFEVPPNSIDAVLLTHAHLDHCGLLPKLVKEGFKGKIYGTHATGEIAQIILLDSAKIQEEDAEYKLKRHRKEGRKGPFPEKPLYTTEDVEVCCPLFLSVKYKQPIQIADGLEATFFDAGHVLGSSIIQIKVNANGQQRTILFSGDMGRPDRPIVQNATSFEQADYVLIESTYGDRVHEAKEDTKKKIADVINSTRPGGNIVIPSFALERSQELLYYINELMLENTIPRMKVFLDSPMASRITKVFQNHRELFDEEMTEHVRHNESPFKFPELTMTGTSDESKRINHIQETCIIIAGSGMCTGGRIKHHLVNNISNPINTIMFVGYQAEGTLGRLILEGRKEIRIHGQNHQVKARITRINGFSAHADRNELFNWLSKLKKPPRKVFVVHGETKSAHAFGDFLREKTNWQVVVPAYQDEIVLD